MALTFTGNATADVVVVPAATSIDDLQAFTWLTWFRYNGDSNARLLYKGGVKAQNLNSTTGDMRFVVDRAVNCEYITDDATFNTDGTVWSFVACTFAEATPAVHMYGGDISTLAVELTSFVGGGTDGSGTPLVDNASDLLIGNRAGLDRGAHGEIAIVHIENSAMTLAEVQAWQFNPRVLADTRLHMPLGFNGVSTQYDFSGNGNDSFSVDVEGVADHVPLRPLWGLDVQLPTMANAGIATQAASIGLLRWQNNIAAKVQAQRFMLPGQPLLHPYYTGAPGSIPTITYSFPAMPPRSKTEIVGY